jgi:hypothetical protein
MTQTYFKATKPDGFDFATGNIDYGSAAKSRTKAGKVVKHPDPIAGASHAGSYLSVATVATDCTGFKWPARLFEVEAVGEVWEPGTYPNKRAVTELRVLRELPAHLVFGPEGERIVAVIAQFDSLTDDQRSKLRAAYGVTATYDAYWEARAVADGGRAARAGLGAARDALYGRLFDFWYGDGYSASGAALALLCRHLIGKKDGITQKQYNDLRRPWCKVMGPIHPDDKVVK